MLLTVNNGLMLRGLIEALLGSSLFLVNQYDVVCYLLTVMCTIFYETSRHCAMMFQIFGICNN